MKYYGISAATRLSLPSINSGNFPGFTENGLAYDTVTNKLFYYNRNLGWTLLQTSGPSSYSLIKSVVPQSILTSTQITNFVNSPVPYHDSTTGWNITTGAYTASSPVTLSIAANITWIGGVSNLGNRITKIMFKPVAAPVIEAKVTETQADPDINSATTQEASISLEMDTGDMAWIEVYHDAGVSLTISNGNETSISGTQIAI